MRIAGNTINELMRRPDGYMQGMFPPEQRPAIVRAGQIDGLRHIWRIEVETGVRPRAYGTQGYGRKRCTLDYGGSRSSCKVFGDQSREHSEKAYYAVLDEHYGDPTN